MRLNADFKLRSIASQVRKSACYESADSEADESDQRLSMDRLSNDTFGNTYENARSAFLWSQPIPKC